MIAEFETSLRSCADFSWVDLKRISSLAVQKVLCRNDFLLLEGDICRHKTFILKGLHRVSAHVWMAANMSCNFP
jgi:CRP/FNR family transcriptional regulator, anaerobic regulatory protein